MLENIKGGGWDADKFVKTSFPPLKNEISNKNIYICNGLDRWVVCSVLH